MHGPEARPRRSRLHNGNDGVQLSKFEAIRLEDIFLLSLPLFQNKLLNISEGP